MRDRLVRASRFALAAFNALVAVDLRSAAVLPRLYRARGTYGYAIARNARAALVAHHVSVFGATVARGGNHLHERRFVIQIGHVALR